jgi:hypothetical protein
VGLVGAPLNIRDHAVDQRIVAPRLEWPNPAHHGAGMGAGRLGQGTQTFALLGVRQIDGRIACLARAASLRKCHIGQVSAAIQDVLSLCHVGSPFLSEFLLQ